VAEIESIVEPESMANNFGGKSVTLAGIDGLILAVLAL
jgi:hypothetical protein